MSYIEVTGDERDALLGAVAGLKADAGVDLFQAIGELTGCSVQTPGDGGSYNVNLLMMNATADDFGTLTAYYKSFSGCTIVFESSNSLVAEYEWGSLNTCRFSEDMGMIQVCFAF
jgi:hypothetical protein